MTQRPSQILPYPQFRQEVERLWPMDSGTSSEVSMSFGLSDLYGDASDGALSTTGNLSWITGTIKQYKTLAINTGHTITSSSTSGATLAIFVSERMVVDGTLHLNSIGGTGSITTSLGGSGGGGGGGVGYAGVIGSATQAVGGAGGLSAGLGSAGTSVTLFDIMEFRLRADSKDDATNSWGARGGSGGGTLPGAGGYGGGALLIFANELTINGTISCNGANGGTGGNASGGGGGGGGGLIWIVTAKLVNNGTVTCNGGSGGAGGAGGGAGGAGGAGSIVY